VTVDIICTETLSARDFALVDMNEPFLEFRVVVPGSIIYCTHTTVETAGC